MKDMKYFKDDFDFSELDKNHQFYDPINKKFIRKMKFETSLVLVLDSFIALRSKSYSFSYNNIPKGTQSGSGIKKYAKQKGIQKISECQDDIRCLFIFENDKQNKVFGLFKLASIIS